eukprot:753131-Hanusia_phi.AAC.2
MEAGGWGIYGHITGTLIYHSKGLHILMAQDNQVDKGGWYSGGWGAWIEGWGCFNIAEVPTALMGGCEKPRTEVGKAGGGGGWLAGGSLKSSYT